MNPNIAEAANDVYSKNEGWTPHLPCAETLLLTAAEFGARIRYLRGSLANPNLDE
jgi:hypothetical protein